MHAARRSLVRWISCLAALGACDTTTDPPPLPTPIDLILDFCADATPAWFAYQNEREPWTVAVPDANGTVRFTAQNRVAIAYVLEEGANYVTEIIGAHNTELDALSSIACLDVSGTKRLNGTVTGVGSGQLGLVTMLFSSVYLSPAQSSYSLTQLADRPLDLIASRVNVSGTTRQAAERIIVRRNQNFVNNATVPALDLDAAAAVTTHPVAVTGIANGESAFLIQNFFSQLRTSHTLYYFDLPASGTFSVPAVPAALTAAGDYHDLFVVSHAANFESFRGAERFGRNGAAVTLPLGAELPDVPAFTAVGTSPYVRLRGSMPVGSYRSAATFELRQDFGGGAVTTVNVTLTESFYAGTPASPWSFELPDFGTLVGWRNAWGLQTGSPITWIATGYLGRAALIFGAPPQEGETITFAGRASAPTPPVAPGGGVSALRRIDATAARRRFLAPRP